MPKRSLPVHQGQTKKPKVEKLEAEKVAECSNDSSEAECEPTEAEGEATEATGAIQSFADLGLHPHLVKICEAKGWTVPTPIQVAAIPPAIEGNDLIGLAVTGSGKTAAFVLPILNSMLPRAPSSSAASKTVDGGGPQSYARPHEFYALCLTPTRELAHQISKQFNELGGQLGLKIVTLIGGGNHTMEVKALANKPQVIVATPGRLVDHISNTQGFTLANLKFLVLDEADRMLTLDFDAELQLIIKASSTSRQTMLFSATMTSQISKLQKVSLRNPVKVSVDEKTSTAANLTQYMVLIPPTEKFPYVATLAHRLAAYRMIIFCNTCKIANVLCAFLKKLGLKAVGLSGDMRQQFRLSAIRQFTNNEKNILVTTEVGSRGLDLPLVAYVVNFDVPANYRDYIHRVGRTARGGNKGTSYTLVTQYDAADLIKIEAKTKKKMLQYTDIKNTDYANINFAEAKAAAEKEYDEAVKKKIFRKKRSGITKDKK